MEKELQNEAVLEMSLKVSPHFECVPVWEMLSLIGERRGNDITDVKATAWGTTA